MNEKPELERLPDDEHSSDTDRNIPLPPSATVPPPRRQNPPHAEAPQIRRVAAPPRRQKRRSGGLYIPLWSILAMLLIVSGIACGIVLVVINLGGNTPETAPPVLIVNSPVPTSSPESFPVSPATATLPAQAGSVINDAPQPPDGFRLLGPTLEAIATSTPTRVPLGIGVIVIVTDVEPDKLNVRDNPSTRETTVVFRADEGTRFTIVDGPQQGDGFTWWQIQNVANANERGWAVSNYLEVDVNQ